MSEDAIVKRETNTLYLITECCGNDTLQTLIDYHREYCFSNWWWRNLNLNADISFCRRKKKPILETFIWAILSQLCIGLHALSSTQDPQHSKISHLCLKPSCVFLQKDTIKLKIGDFGLGLMSKSYYKCPVSLWFIFAQMIVC